MRTGPLNHITLFSDSIAGTLRNGWLMAVGLLTLATTTLVALNDPVLSSVALAATYTAETLSVTRGGWHQGTASRGLAEIALSTDLHKAMNAPAGTTFHVSGLHPALGDLGKTYPSVLHGVRNIAVHNHPRLPDVLWIRQSEDHALWRVPARSAAVPAWLCSLVL